MIVIETDRLALRYLRPDDLDAFAALLSDPEVYRFMDDGEPLSRELTERWIDVSLANYAARGYGCFAVTHRGGNDDRMIGFAGFARPSDRPGIVEIIYALPPAQWGQGYATEIARGLIAFGFASPGPGQPPRMERIEATVDPANPASARVLIKAGMTYDGRRPDGDAGETDYFSIDRPIAPFDPR